MCVTTVKASSREGERGDAAPPWALVYACARLQAEIVLQTARERETTQAVQKAE